MSSEKTNDKNQSSSLLNIIDLKKQYSSGFTFGPASFSFEKGKTIAVLGANGSGKSTLFQMLTGNSDPSSGSIFWKDKKLSPDSFTLKRKIGYLPQNLNLPPWVSGIEVLTYAANLYQLPQAKKRIHDSLHYWECESYAKQALSSCSHGMQKRIALALANIHDPSLLILDEPFSGLDLFHIKALEQIIIERNKKGHTTILSTHIAPYVAKLCHKIYLLKRGQLSHLSKWSEKNFEDKISAIEDQFFKSDLNADTKIQAQPF